MKKYLLIFVLFSTVNSCQKSDLQVNPQLSLLDELTGISKLDFSGLIQVYGDKCLKINPYSYVGDMVEESILEFDKLLQSGKGEVELKSSELVRLIKSKLSPDITRLSEDEFTELEAEVYSIILTSLVADDFFTLNYKIACFEHIISNAECLNLHSKQRILVYCSSFRGVANCFNNITSQTKGETWEECFIRKQQEKMESGIIEKLRCVVMWPECLGIMAADCLLDQIF